MIVDNGDDTFSIVRRPCPITKDQAYGIALEAGFMLSTQYGQDDGKMMPATDGATLMRLIKLIEKAHGIV